MQPAIEVSGLGKSFGGQSVLSGLDFTVAPGEVFALLGPERGRQDHHDQHPHDPRATRRGARDRRRDSTSSATPSRCSQRISLTGQSAAVDDVLTGAENLVMLGRLSGLGATAAKARATELLERFDLGDASRRRVATYSGGMRRRLDLALSFVVTPAVLFLDEPTTGLDTRSRRELWDVIRSARGCRHDGAS